VDGYIHHYKILVILIFTLDSRCQSRKIRYFFLYFGIKSSYFLLNISLYLFPILIISYLLFLISYLLSLIS